jgi:hypothetical protein
LFIIRRHTVALPIFRQAVDANDTGAGSAISLRLQRKIAEVGRNYDETSGKIGMQFIQVYQFFGMVIVRITENQPIVI